MFLAKGASVRLLICVCVCVHLFTYFQEMVCVWGITWDKEHFL